MMMVGAVMACLANKNFPVHLFCCCKTNQQKKIKVLSVWIEIMSANTQRRLLFFFECFFKNLLLFLYGCTSLDVLYVCMYISPFQLSQFTVLLQTWHDSRFFQEWFRFHLLHVEKCNEKRIGDPAKIDVFIH